MAVHPSVDWQKVLGTLKYRHGMSLRDIGRAVELDHTTVRAYLYGIATPKHASGERIIELWMRIAEKSRADLPMTVQ